MLILESVHDIADIRITGIFRQKCGMMRAHPRPAQEQQRRLLVGNGFEQRFHELLLAVRLPRDAQERRGHRVGVRQAHMHPFRRCADIHQNGARRAFIGIAGGVFRVFFKHFPCLSCRQDLHALPHPSKTRSIIHPAQE